MFVISSQRTPLRVIAKSAMTSLNAGNSLPRAADEGRKTISPVFIVAADESQQMEGEKLAHALEENGIIIHGFDIINNAKEAKLIAYFPTKSFPFDSVLLPKSLPNWSVLSLFRCTNDSSTLTRRVKCHDPR
jgi:hypothetical protein